MRTEKVVKKDAGFTLAELIVSFAVMMILASLSIGGILAYQDYADYKRQNSYAQTLFSAAQTKLTDLSVRGQREELEKAAINPLDLGTVITPDGTLASEKQNGESVKEGGVYYLLWNRKSYELYRSGELDGESDADSKSAQALYEILDEFLFDETILNACIAIEYNPGSGQVYSVLYSDKCNEFTYIGTTKDGRVNILNRQEDYRNKYMIGYYGID